MQGIPKADAEAALRHAGNGDEAAIYVASIHPAKAAEVEERRFSAPQVHFDNALLACVMAQVLYARK